jgi:hypothetical protein
MKYLQSQELSIETIIKRNTFELFNKYKNNLGSISIRKRKMKVLENDYLCLA